MIGVPTCPASNGAIGRGARGASGASGAGAIRGSQGPGQRGQPGVSPLDGAMVIGSLDNYHLDGHEPMVGVIANMGGGNGHWIFGNGRDLWIISIYLDISPS